MFKIPGVNYTSLAKRIVVIAGLALLILAGSSLFFIWKYQDKIISLVVAELSKKLDTQAKVGKAELSLRKFPDLSVHFINVVIKGSLPEEDTLLVADNIYCSFRLWHVFNQKYRIRQVFFEKGHLKIKRKDHQDNYRIFKTSSGNSGSALMLNIEKLIIKDFKIDYNDFDRSQFYSYETGICNAVLDIKENILNTRLKGSFVSTIMKANEHLFARNLPFDLDVDLAYQLNSHDIEFRKSIFSALNSSFAITGNVTEKDYRFLIDGKETNIQTLLALMPEGVGKNLKEYRSKGDVYFSSDIKGLMEDDVPSIEIQFGCENAQFYHPKYREAIKNVSLKGSYTNGRERNSRTSVLKLNNIAGKLNNRDFRGNLHLSNFRNAYLSFDLLANLDATSLLKFFPISKLSKARGELSVDVQFKGLLNDMQNVNRLNRVKSTGEINFRDLDFEMKDVLLSFDDFSGNLVFQDDAVAISSFSGKISNTDFLINGFIKNGLAYLLFENVPLIVEADLISEKIMLNELLTGKSSNIEGMPDSYNFRISPRLDINFNCRVGYLEFRRFQARDIRGQLAVRDRKASSKEISFQAMGGKMSLNGSVDARRENDIKVFTSTRLERIDIDRLFYVFEEFNQDFLTSNHLKGQIFADINTFMVFDSKLSLATDKLISNISISIKNGELNNFEPMQKLNTYVDEKSLERLRFSELRNNILVHDRNIYLPQMEVASNVTKLRVSGTHTFDQHINYRISTPLHRYNRNDRDERFGYVKDDGKGNLSLLLRIHGTTQDYKVSFDGEALKDNIRQGVKSEAQELREVFINKGQTTQEETIELNEDEFFDF